jgi:hypothetical protein
VQIETNGEKQRDRDRQMERLENAQKDAQRE